MDQVELELLRGEVDHLVEALDQVRFRHVAGLEPEPSLVAIFDAHSRAAHRQTAATLREAGEPALAGQVAALRAERVAAADEERWRAADAIASAEGPDGGVELGSAARSIRTERNRDRRLAFGRALAQAAGACAAARESAAEQRARARAEVGLTPDWDRVLEADDLLDESDDAYADVLAWLARRELSLSPPPHGDLKRADLLHLLALPRYDGLFKPGMLPLVLHAALESLGLHQPKIDEGDRPGQWLGAHVFGVRVSLRRMGGAADYLDLLAAAGSVAVARAAPFHARDPAMAEAVGTLLRRLWFEPRFLADRLDVEKRDAADLVRGLALRELFRLRTHAAALRVATEVERGMSGAAWHETHREALTLAARASWPGGLAARDVDPARHANALTGAAAAEALRREFTERYDEDWWRNPRARSALAGLLAAGRIPSDKRPPPELAWAGPVAKLG
jgi:hypothetical protein